MATRAAQYVRMSTDEQTGSIEIQKRAIAQYAATHGLEIVATYADEGKSGLSVGGRGGMRQLLRDVLQVSRAFSTVLVLDVSRWGRFQDVDEAAYYEYHCRKNGVQVVYVAEAFPTSGRPMDTVLKYIKRVMAAEYSRELAVKTRAGKEKVLREGYSAGHNAQLGFRRQVVSPEPQRCIVLEPGERKAVMSDRVRVIAGPTHERLLVARIFDLYTRTSISIRGLVQMLNAEGHRTVEGRPYSECVVRTILGNRMYIGEAAWGQTHSSMGVSLPARSEAIFHQKVPAIVGLDVFEKARLRLSQNARKPWTRSELLACLRDAVDKHPLISANSFAGHGYPSRQVYANVFGSFTAALQEIGHKPLRKCGNHLNRTHAYSGGFVVKIGTELASLGAEVTFTRKKRSVEVNGWTLGILVVAPVKHKLRVAWPIVKTRVAHCDLLLILRIDASGTCLDFYLVPNEDRSHFPGTLYGDNDPPSANKYRVHDLSFLALLQADDRRRRPERTSRALVERR